MHKEKFLRTSFVIGIVAISLVALVDNAGWAGACWIYPLHNDAPACCSNLPATDTKGNRYLDSSAGCTALAAWADTSGTMPTGYEPRTTCRTTHRGQPVHSCL